MKKKPCPSAPVPPHSQLTLSLSRSLSSAFPFAATTLLRATAAPPNPSAGVAAPSLTASAMDGHGSEYPDYYSQSSSSVDLNGSGPSSPPSSATSASSPKRHRMVRAPPLDAAWRGWI